MTLTDSPKVVPATAFGRRFRSTTEARWAVFLTEAGIAWEYEPESYDLGRLGWYLPDFWLPGLQWFLEVKRSGPLPFEAEAKLRRLAVVTDKPSAVVKGFGMPFFSGHFNSVPDFWGGGEDMPGRLLVFLPHQKPPAMLSASAFSVCRCGRPGWDLDEHVYTCQGPDTQRLRHAYEAAAAFRPDNR